MVKCCVTLANITAALVSRRREAVWFLVTLSLCIRYCTVFSAKLRFCFHHVGFFQDVFMELWKIYPDSRALENYPELGQFTLECLRLAWNLSLQVHSLVN